MAVKTKDEIMASIRARIGDDQSDDALALVEDVSDTFDSMTPASADGIDWKKKYEDNDAEWRRKYRDRFFMSDAKGKESDSDFEDDPKPKRMRFEDLFKED